MTPMMEQYFEIKEQYRDYLLFYRLGDFYEMFFDDAIVASRELELTLTGRDCGEAERAPMCGVPFHAVEDYIGKLIEKGYKVAICEQMEDPALAKGLVKRDVIRVITPGTLIESNLLPEQKNNYLCCLCMGEFVGGICFADISTAQVYATELAGSDMEARIKNELAVYAPREVLCNLNRAHMGEVGEWFAARPEIMLSDAQASRFARDTAETAVRDQFGDSLKDAFFENDEMVRAVGAMVTYIRENERRDISYMKNLTVYSDGQFLEIDSSSRRNLELTESMRTKKKTGSLLWVLDKTRTAPGARMLRSWVEHPLLSTGDIRERQDAVGELAGNFMLREDLGEELTHVADLERLITKIVYGTANPRDLLSVAATALALPAIKKLIGSCTCHRLAAIAAELDTLDDIANEVGRAIKPDANVMLREGNIIADGFNKDVDHLRAVMQDGSGWKERIEAEEREKTGIKTLRVSYNRVFGYYIEVTKSLVGQVPTDRYIRKQTLANAERYITDELKDMEATVLGASDKICALEYELFQEVRNFVAERSARIQRTAALLAEIDCCRSLGEVAQKNKYVRPEVDQSDVISIRDGRHPVVEQFVKNSYFVPNDTELDTARNRLMLITGPNMAGKSTYMRQTALIIIMAQLGSFVPASSAHIGVVDKLFTRIGASDDLAAGQSTFMLEMTECANILKNATSHSFILYDEIGRGTSTYDGMSIARAIVEYTVSKKLYAKTMFATHYHELTELEQLCRGVVNYNIVAKKRGEELIFLRKIVRGAADDSYGIEVARLAGVPEEVVRRADKILASIDEHESVRPKKELLPKREENATMGLETMLYDRVCDSIKKIDINTLTPIEALSKLYEMKKILDGE